MMGNRLEEILIGMKTTAFAVINPDGKLTAASKGFLKLLPRNQGEMESPNVSRFFIQPSFETLNASFQDGYSGLFTIGARSGQTATLYGTFYSDNGISYFLAEHDLGDINGNPAKFSNLIIELSETQRQLMASNAALGKLEKEAVERSFIDPLTGLGNRRRLEQGLVTEISRARRAKKRLSLIMSDLDKFKDINDKFGHDVGDIVLKEFANIISLSIREYDIATRFGGEEFVILMPHMDLDNAVAAADRIRTALEAKDFNPHAIKVTASFGVATLSSNDSPEAFLKRADDAMYEAKNSGRNRVVSARQEISSDGEALR